MIRIKAVFLSILIISMLGAYAQQHKIDSVLNFLKTSREDSSKINALLFLAGQQQDVSNYLKSDSLAKEALNLSNKLSYSKGIAYSYTYFGLNAYYQGNYAKAIEHYFYSLNIEDKIGDKRGQAIALNNIGLTYNMMKDYDHALSYYFKGLYLKQKIGDVRGTATSLNNIGLIYYKKKVYDSALAYFNKSLDIKAGYGDKRGMASNYNNIGTVYSAQGKYDIALETMQKALKIKEEFDDKFGIVSSYISIGELYLNMNKYADALNMEFKALEMGQKIRALDEVQDDEKLISITYEKKKDGMNALQHYKAYIIARDSIFNKENTKKTVSAEMNFEFQKQQAAIKAEQDKKDVLEKEKERKQQIMIYFISSILLLVIGFAIFAYRSNLQKQQANKELDKRNKKIEAAYTIIEEKNKQITDSINYAKRIQRALLPTKDELKKIFPNSFILFKPKDIVSGDFYFFKTNKEGKMVFAVADCTGHGVPGAFMSMIGTEKLQEATEQARGTGEILNMLNKGIKTSLKQSDEADSTHDGMDIVLCVMDGSNLQYSGANRPLWIVRKDKSEIEEIKATKKAIGGGFTEEDVNFTSHNLLLDKGDTIYMFSDGYTDQFGGVDGKKLTTKRFRDLILSLQGKPMAKQKKELSVFIEKWRDQREQLDDILVMGIKV
jgi:serine phosphatase RsbU (regulator of sigma subunit)/tetratricopeptide (TPR) repeat protein